MNKIPSMGQKIMQGYYYCFILSGQAKRVSVYTNF